MRVTSRPIGVLTMFLFTGVVFTGLLSEGQQSSQRMTNQDVIDMVALGLSDNVIIQKLRTIESPQFDTSVQGLRMLKSGKVSDAVILVMINPHADATSARTGVVPSPSSQQIIRQSAADSANGAATIANGAAASVTPTPAPAPDARSAAEIIATVSSTEYAIRATSEIRDEMYDPTAFTILQVIAITKKEKDGRISYRGCVHYVGSNLNGGRLQRWGGYSANKKGELRSWAGGEYDTCSIYKNDVEVDVTADVSKILGQ
jgi:hypothetical protein